MILRNKRFPGTAALVVALLFIPGINSLTFALKDHGDAGAFFFTAGILDATLINVSLR